MIRPVFYGVAALMLGAVAGPVSAEAPQPKADKPQAVSMLFWTPEERQRWFKEVEAVLDTRLVRRGSVVRPLSVAATEIAPTMKVNGQIWTLDDYMKTYNVSGILVMRDGEILLERYGLGREPDDRWTSFSVAKSVTSLLAGAAIQDGKISLQDPVEKFVPELKGSAYEGVSFEQLLMMASGVRWVEEYTNPESDIVQIGLYQASGRDALEYLAKLPRVHEPGSTFHYNSPETNLAGIMISRATGRTLSDYLSEKIWQPYGMEDDALWIVDNRGREQAGCCLSMTLRDYGRLGQFVLENGTIDGNPVVPPNWIEQSTTARISIGRPAPAGYGYFWWIGERAFEASGIFGQSILIYPKERLVIVQNAAWPTPETDELFAALSLFQGAVHDLAAPEFPKTIRD